jgi:hypothetical protein
MENKERREIFFKFSLFIFHLFSKFFTLPDRKRAFAVVRLKPWMIFAVTMGSLHSVTATIYFAVSSRLQES